MCVFVVVLCAMLQGANLFVCVFVCPCALLCLCVVSVRYSVKSYGMFLVVCCVVFVRACICVVSF